jgi:hypothetical protein
MHEIDAAVRIEAAQLLQQAGDVGAFGQARGEARLRHRLGRCEDHGFQEPDLLKTFVAHSFVT